MLPGEEPEIAINNNLLRIMNNSCKADRIAAYNASIEEL